MDNVLSAETWLFGEVGQAFYHQNDQYFKVSVRDETPTPCRAQEMNVLYDACMDAPIYLSYVLPPEQLSEKLWEWYEKYSALEFFLDGLDVTLDEELRINCIRDVEETFEENEEAYQFVRQRFLSRPLPNEADIKNAIKYAKTQKVKQLYQDAVVLEKSKVRQLYQDAVVLEKSFELRKGIYLSININLELDQYFPNLRTMDADQLLEMMKALRNLKLPPELDQEEQSELLTKQSGNSIMSKLKDYFNQSPIIKKS